MAGTDSAEIGGVNPTDEILERLPVPEPGYWYALAHPIILTPCRDLCHILTITGTGQQLLSSDANGRWLYYGQLWTRLRPAKEDWLC